MSTPKQPTHIAVPFDLWKQTITLISKEMTIEKGVDIWQGLMQCKPIIGTPVDIDMKAPTGGEAK